MSLMKTREHLIQLLGDADNDVIALSGKWGTGKTHLWQEVKNESSEDKVKAALYVSLFGLSSIDQVKRTLIERAIPGVESHGAIFDGLKNLYKAGIKVASDHYKALAALSDLNVLLMAPVALGGKLIVIDDIERKHGTLGIDEVLGFINEYSEQHGSRFVLVLNDEQLSSNDDQAKLWTTLREKVIDHEVKLSTSADEAFSIAIGLAPSKYAEFLKRASIACGLTNIRIIVKIIRAANRILVGRQLEAAIQARVVPSIVLFAAIHYRGLEDGPDFEFALRAGTHDRHGFGRDKKIEPTAQQKREDRWWMLMQELGIALCDEFEPTLVEFLESGLFEPARIVAIIDRYVAVQDRLEAYQKARNFLTRVYWDHRVGEAQLVAEATELPSIAILLDPYTASELEESLSKLPGGGPIGQAILDGWIAGYRLNKPTDIGDQNYFDRPLHEAIRAEFAAVKEQAQASTTVLDACLHIIEEQSWDTLQAIAMRHATAEDFVIAIRELDVERLRRFLRGMIAMCHKKEINDAHFGTATERFMEACRTIASDSASPRLADLMKRLFAGTALEPELTPNQRVTSIGKAEEESPDTMQL